MKICQVTNIPAPYRERVHELVCSLLEGNYHVIYSKVNEGNREWRFKLGNYQYSFLKSSTLKHKFGEVHYNLSIWDVLNEIDTDVIIIGGVGPNQLLAFTWAKMKNKKIIALSDSFLYCEQDYSFVHKALRKCVYSFVDGFIGASLKTKVLFQHYSKLGKRPFRLSPLSIDERKFNFSSEKNEKEYDLLFSGQFVKRKNPFFFIELANIINKRKKGGIRVAMLGSGELLEDSKRMLKNYNIEFTCPGFVQQNELPEYYRKSKLFLFPTERDPWGLVVNEACAAGLPVITTNFAGVANELVIHEQNGFVLDLKLEEWATKVIQLLEDEEMYKSHSYFSQKQVKLFSQEVAAEELVECCKIVMR